MTQMWMIGVYMAIALSGLLGTITLVATFFYLYQKMKRQRSPSKNQDSEVQWLRLSSRTITDKKVSFDGGSQYNVDGPVVDHRMLLGNYSFHQLQQATNDFNPSNLIEGDVYRGRLNGKDLAVKRIPSEALSRYDFALLQGRIYHQHQHHPNIMRLLGICVTEDPVSFIVLEYAENGSVKDWIHGGLAMKSQFIVSCNCFLTWNVKLKICLDVATALEYMHHSINPSYVHRNIRSRNIFLDQQFNVKICDFGMADMFENESEAKAYLAPEYIAGGTISPGLDVFAYGVVLLEILSGKPPLQQDNEMGEGKCRKLSEEIKRILETEDAEELREWIDGALGDDYSFDRAVTLANLAKSCQEDDPSSRPNAAKIVKKLLRLTAELQAPEEEVEDSSYALSGNPCKPLVRGSEATTSSSRLCRTCRLLI